MGNNAVPMDTGLDEFGQPLTTMKLRFDDGSPHQIEIDGRTASEWKLVPKPGVAGEFLWEPL